MIGLSVNSGFLVMGLPFKILFAMVAMIWQSVLI